MRLYFKIKAEQARIIAKKVKEEALKLCFAVVVAELVLVVVFSIGVNYGLLDILKPKTVIIEVVKAQDTTKQEPQEPKIDNTSELADYIYLKESTRGKNNYSQCENIGKVNGIGYGISGNGNYICFESHAEEMKVLNKWIEDHQNQNMSDEELLRHYSGGHYGSK